MSLASGHLCTAIQALAADGSNACSLTQQCTQAGQRCLTLPNELGGVDYSGAELQQFIEILYNPGSLSMASSKMVLHQGTARYVCTNHPSTGYEVVYNLNGDKLDVAAETKGSEIIQSGHVSKKNLVRDFTVTPAKVTSDDALGPFLEQNKQNIELSVYFDCPQFESVLEAVCNSAVVDNAELAGNYDSLWNLFLVAEKCRFKDISLLVTALSKDKDAKSRQSWKNVNALFDTGRGRLSSLQQLCQALIEGASS